MKDDGRQMRSPHLTGALIWEDQLMGGLISPGRWSEDRAVESILNVIVGTVQPTGANVDVPAALRHSGGVWPSPVFTGGSRWCCGNLRKSTNLSAVKRASLRIAE